VRSSGNSLFLSLSLSPPLACDANFKLVARASYAFQDAVKLNSRCLSFAVFLSLSGKRNKERKETRPMQRTRSLTRTLKGPASGADDRTGSDPERSGAMRRAARFAGRVCVRGNERSRVPPRLLCMQLLSQHSPLHSRVTVKQTGPSAKTQVSLDVFI